MIFCLKIQNCLPLSCRSNRTRHRRRIRAVRTNRGTFAAAGHSRAFRRNPIDERSASMSLALRGGLRRAPELSKHNNITVKIALNHNYFQ